MQNRTTLASSIPRQMGGGEEGELTNQHKKKIDNNFALFLVSSVVLLGSSKLLQTF